MSKSFVPPVTPRVDVRPSTPPPFDPADGFWVFGYGSLLWNPGFAFAERRPAVLRNYARRFCLWSVRYRGTPERPGLVLALMPETGAATRGVAYRVAPEEGGGVFDYLREREMVTDAYDELHLGVDLADGSEGEPTHVASLTYAIDPSHRQCAAGLTLDQQADVIAASVGPAGANAEYLFNTVDHLRDLGALDDELAELYDLVRHRLGRGL
ncbi:MAG: gamma-glutamylcyclotransferase [Pseudomonadota bacterium]